MRFRHKLTIMFVVLALVPLVASALLAASLVPRNQISHVDGRLNAAVTGGLAAYKGQLRQAADTASAFAARPEVSRALAGKRDPAKVVSKRPGGLYLQLLRTGTVLAGTPPPGPAWRVPVAVGSKAKGRQLVAWQPINGALLRSLAGPFVRAPQVELELVSGGRVVAATDGRTGPAPALPVARAADVSLAGVGQRVQAVNLPGVANGHTALVASYPSASLNDAIDSRRLQLLVPLAIAALVVAAAAFLAAGRISQALTELSARARTLLRPGSSLRRAPTSCPS